MIRSSVSTLKVRSGIMILIICLHPEGKVRYYDSDHLSVHRAFEIATNIACQQVNSLTSQSDLIILPTG